MAENSNDKMKELMQEVAKNLAAKGVKVDAAAIMSFADQPSQPKSFDSFVKDVIKKTIDKMENKDPKEKCYCPNCFNFENFEQALADVPGTMDYAEFQIGGKTFEAKYHCDLEGNDKMLIRKKEFGINPEWTVDQLQEGLNTAIATKRFDEAQKFLEALKNLKK